MGAWSNLEISEKDTEIIRIDQFEGELGKLPPEIYKIRELITRHEVCHFKFKQHIKNITESISKLKPVVEANEIGSNHIQHGESAWKRDRTGRSLLGQQYVWATQNWLKETPANENPEKFDSKIGEDVQQWLGEKGTEKVGLVRLLLARMTWDWKTYEELMQGDMHKELKFQIARIDICHYAFPENLERILKGIGAMQPLEKFEGCGSFTEDIQRYIQKELGGLKAQFETLCADGREDKEKLVKVWLFGCLIKTLKEHVGLTEPTLGFENLAD